MSREVLKKVGSHEQLKSITECIEWHGGRRTNSRNASESPALLSNMISSVLLTTSYQKYQNTGKGALFKQISLCVSRLWKQLHAMMYERTVNLYYYEILWKADNIEPSETIEIDKNQYLLHDCEQHGNSTKQNLVEKQNLSLTLMLVSMSFSKRYKATSWGLFTWRALRCSNSRIRTNRSSKLVFSTFKGFCKRRAKKHDFPLSCQSIPRIKITCQRGAKKVEANPAKNYVSGRGDDKSSIR